MSTCRKSHARIPGACSIALVGFGLDSVIEFAAAAVVVWQLRGENQDPETRAVRLIGVTFFALAAYLAVEGISDLISQARPGQSPAGMAVTSAALLVMPSLAVAKHRTGTALGNRTPVADAAESAFCARTSAAALLALGLNAWLGWWWADPAAALVIAALAAKESLEAWEENLPPRRWPCRMPKPQAVSSGHSRTQAEATAPRSRGRSAW